MLPNTPKNANISFFPIGSSPRVKTLPLKNFLANVQTGEYTVFYKTRDTL